MSGNDVQSASEFVVLRGGLTVRVEVVRLLLRLEALGVTLEIDGPDILIHAHHAQRVTDEDRAVLRRFKPQVLALINHCEVVQ